MKKSIILIIIATFLFVTNINMKAQKLADIYDKSHVKDRVSVSYQFLREADVMWSKIVWRKIDLREKINLPLYYPDDTPIGDRMSLIDLLMRGIKNQGLTAFTENGSDEFGSIMTIKDIEEKFGAKSEIQSIDNIDNGEIDEVVIEGSYNTKDVKQYLVKELWFLDKQRAVLKVRIIGICPIREYYKDDDIDQEYVKYKKLFWIYFPEARNIFANHEVFNPHNDAERITFDDVFFKRMFSSYIVQESNIYNNRRISDYTLGLEALLEAERIKEKILNFEQDLWEY